MKKLEISNKKEWRLAALCLMVNIVSLLFLLYLQKGSIRMDEKKAMMRKYEKNIQSHPLTIVALIIYSSLYSGCSV